MLNLNIQSALSFAKDTNIEEYKDKSIKAKQILLDASGQGNEFLGWLNLPQDIENQLENIIKQAEKFRKQANYTVVIGIGGSYLGAKAVSHSLQSEFLEEKHKLLFAGNNISGKYLNDLLLFLKDKDFNICVISKSGTTLEPSIAFRLLKDLLEKKHANDANKFISCVTDKKKGALRERLKYEDFASFVLEDNIGGRFSVFSPVGLFPLAIKGVDIRALIAGAQKYQEELKNQDYDNNIALQYAVIRNMLLDSNYNIEAMVNWEPSMIYIAEWWKQLFGESEGKEKKGIFPASLLNSTDLHSMGQYMQDGQRMVFETFIKIKNYQSELEVPFNDKDFDKLNYIAGKKVDFVNSCATEATQDAHLCGGTPVIEIEMDDIDEENIGALLYFFEFSCAISAYMLGVNPFNQPGVEAYKKRMFKLLVK